MTDKEPENASTADITERVSGFKVTGSWGEIVELGEQITEALKQIGQTGTPFDEWNEWRPKVDERLSEEMKDKTAEQARLSENDREKRGDGPKRDLQTAARDLEQTYARIREEDSPKESAQRSIGHATRAAETAVRRAVRAAETKVYRKVMTRFAPYYFDNELISANIQRTGSVFSQPTYEFEINVNDDALKERVSTLLQSFDDNIDRWHLNAPVNTEIQEQAGEVENPTDNDLENSQVN